MAPATSLNAVQAGNEIRHASELEVIEDLLSALVTADDTGLWQDLEVLRHGGPAEAKALTAHAPRRVRRRHW